MSCSNKKKSAPKNIESEEDERVFFELYEKAKCNSTKHLITLLVNYGREKYKLSDKELAELLG